MKQSANCFQFIERYIIGMNNRDGFREGMTEGRRTHERRYHARGTSKEKSKRRMTRYCSVYRLILVCIMPNACYGRNKIGMKMYKNHTMFVLCSTWFLWLLFPVSLICFSSFRPPHCSSSSSLKASFFFNQAQQQLTGPTNRKHRLEIVGHFCAVAISKPSWGVRGGKPQAGGGRHAESHAVAR